MNDSSRTDAVIGIGLLIEVALIISKGLGFINWSWWLVLAPLWVPLAFGAVLVILMIGAYIIRFGGSSNETDSDRE